MSDFPPVLEVDPFRIGESKWPVAEANAMPAILLVDSKKIKEYQPENISNTHLYFFKINMALGNPFPVVDFSYRSLARLPEKPSTVDRRKIGCVINACCINRYGKRCLIEKYMKIPTCKCVEVKDRSCKLIVCTVPPLTGSMAWMCRHTGSDAGGCGTKLRFTGNFK